MSIWYLFILAFSSNFLSTMTMAMKSFEFVLSFFYEIAQLIYNNNSQCESHFRQIWQDTNVGDLNYMCTTADKETVLDRPT